MMLYKFHKLKEHLDRNGYPAFSGGEKYKQIVKNLATEFKKGNILFEDGEIFYLAEDGKKYKTYTYLPNADVRQNGYPKFHVTSCKTIEEFKANNSFNAKYIVGNTEKVNITDRNTGEIHEDVTLKLCGNCSRLLGTQNKIQTTADFFNAIPKEIHAADTPTDIGGYVLGWANISKSFKALHNYTCSRCAIKVTDPLHAGYIHVHHKNGNKLDNRNENLSCLCIHCHSIVDDNHRKQFSRRGQQAKINNFLKFYKKPI